MASLIPGFKYDIFISYRQKDNKGDRWVSEFVEALKTELESTFKEEISVYFDVNPHDGLLETHDVDASLKEKLKCLIFIPVISRTYCDPKSFAWEHEFRTFIEKASQDQFGLKIKLPNGNVANRVLPIQIHEISLDDKACIDETLGGILRPIEFIYKEPGVNRPLRSNEDHPDNNLNKTFYRNQINKVANAIDEIIYSIKIAEIAPAIEKTLYEEPVEKIKMEESTFKKEKSSKITRRKLFSGIAILTTLIIAIVLTYPKILKGRDNLKAMTTTISVTNENGEKEIRKVFKDEYIVRLSLFPFTNEANDSSANWLQYGIFEALFEDLNQFNYFIQWGSPSAKHLQEQIKYAKTNNYSHFLTGSFRITKGIYEITSRLYKTSNGTVEKERTFKGNDFFNLIDSISLQARIDLGISENVLKSYPCLPFKEHLTSNFNAFRYFIIGLYIDSLAINLHRAIELDSTYALASYLRAEYNYNFQKSNESAHTDIKQAMRHRNRLSEYNDISTRILYYLILGENDKAIALSEMQHELQPHNILLLSRLLDTYVRNFLVYKYQKAAQQMAELVPNIPDCQIDLARSCLFTGELNKGLEVLGRLLNDNPENVDALLLMGELYLHKNDLKSAERTYQKAILIQPENEKYWSRILDHIAYIRNNSIKQTNLNTFTGNFQLETYGEGNCTFIIYNNYLVGKAKNQESFFNYPVSDTQLVYYNGLQTFTFLRNKQGEVINAIYRDEDSPALIVWKEDSLILEAKNLLNNNKSEALAKFREAYTHNPEHYYLANFIHHLEFIQSNEYKRIKPVLEICLGEYGNMAIFKKNDMFYYKNTAGFIYKLLPLSQDQFMIPSFYNRQVQIIKKNNSITGLKFLYRDGKEEFISRNN